MLTINRIARIATASICCAMVAPASAATFSAAGWFTDYGTQGNQQPDLFTIANLSDLGLDIVQLTIDLSGASNAPVFDTLDGASPSYAYNQMLGVPITGLGMSAAVGFVTPTAAQQASWEEAQSITLDFTDFNPGEIFSFYGDVDDLLDFYLPGFEFTGATLTVVFSDGISLFSGTGSYFPIAGPPINDSVAFVTGTTVIPVPGALLLLVSALTGLAFTRRRRT